jgi:hypothetical protein
LKNTKDFIKLNYVFDKTAFDILPGNVKREWMDKTNGHAYKCLPLNIANQYGWVVHSPIDLIATWDGTNGLDAIKVYPEKNGYFSSHFGHGILTLNVDFIITTSKNISTYVKGVSNFNIDKIYPLEGIVETDWLPFTFTMNYKFHALGATSIKKGDPLFMFFPINRSFLEDIEIKSGNIKEDRELSEKYNEYSKSREIFLNNTYKNSQEWQKFYVKGRVVKEKADIYNHKVNIKLKNFEES